MTQLHEALNNINTSKDVQKVDIVTEVADVIVSSGYQLVEQDDMRPWGAFFRLANNDADKFVQEFFQDLNPADARLGNENAELSPKILLVSPEQRLSWQYHERRAERWAFITPGGYHRSLSDEQGNLYNAEGGDVVQFSQGERHRLTGAIGYYTLVAEIWQHIYDNQPSDEVDIIRLQDDYSR